VHQIIYQNTKIYKLTPISLPFAPFCCCYFSDFLGLIQNTLKVPLNWCNGQTVSPSTTFDLFVANNEFVVTIAIITLKSAYHL